MGDRLGTLGAVGIKHFSFYSFFNVTLLEIQNILSINSRVDNCYKDVTYLKLLISTLLGK